MGGGGDDSAMGGADAIDVDSDGPTDKELDDMLDHGVAVLQAQPLTDASQARPATSLSQDLAVMIEAEDLT